MKHIEEIINVWVVCFFLLVSRETVFVVLYGLDS
jgi:hypothetical protein